NPGVAQERFDARGDRLADHDGSADSLEIRVQLGEAFVEPAGNLESGLADEQMSVFVNGSGVEFVRRPFHHDVVVIDAGLEKGVRNIDGTVGLEFLIGAEADDADGLGAGSGEREGLEEEAADLLEVLDEVAAMALTGGGEELEVGGAYAEPWVARGWHRGGE